MASAIIALTYGADFLTSKRAAAALPLTKGAAEVRPLSIKKLLSLQDETSRHNHRHRLRVRDLPFQHP